MNQLKNLCRAKVQYLAWVLVFAYWLFPVSARAVGGTNYTATITFTNPAGTANGQSLTLYLNSTNGVVYQWTNINPVGFHQLAATNSATKSATNLYAKFARDYTNTAAISYGSSTSVVFQVINIPLNLTLSTNWGTVTITSNPLTANADISARTVTADAIVLNGDRRTGWPAGGGAGGGISSVNGLTGSNLVISSSADIVVTPSGTNINLTLTNAGTAGTYTKVTTDSKGRVTSGTTLARADVPSLLYATNVDGNITNSLTVVGTNANIKITGTNATLALTNASATANFRSYKWSLPNAGGLFLRHYTDSGASEDIIIVPDSFSLPVQFQNYAVQVGQLNLLSSNVTLRGDDSFIVGSTNFVSPEPGATNHLTTLNYVTNNYVAKATLTAKGSILARSATGIGEFPVGPDGTMAIADSSQTFGLRYGNVVAVATNAVGNYVGTGTNTTITGDTTAYSPLRITSGISSYAALDFNDVSGFGSSINWRNTANTNAAPVWAIGTDVLTNGTWRLTSGGSNAISVDRSTFTTTVRELVGGSVSATNVNGTNVNADIVTANHVNSAEFGSGAFAGGFLATAVGGSSAANGDRTIVAGYGAQSAGLRGTAIGASSNADAERSTAIGGSAIALAYRSSAFGSGAATGPDHQFSTAIGYNANTTDSNQVMIGRSEDTVVFPGAFTFGGVTRTNWPSGGGVTTDNVLYVAKNGNDATGTRGRLDLPFLTIGQAKTNSHAGDLIYVYPGLYDESNLASTNLNYYFSAGSIVSNSSIDRYIFSDVGFDSGVNITISGSGQFINNSSADNSDQLAAFYSSNTNSAWSVKCKSAYQFDTGDTPRVISIGNCLRFHFQSDSIEGATTGIYWQNGSDIHINVQRITATQYPIWEEANGTNAIDMYVTTDFIDGETIATGSNPNAASWVTSKKHTGSQGAVVSNGGSGKIYEDSQKIVAVGDNAASVIGATSGKIWVKASKISSEESAPYISNSGGLIDVTCQQYEDNGMTVSGIIISGGTTKLHGGTINTVASAQSAVSISGGTLVLMQCALVTSNSVNCITASSSQNVINYGSVANMTTNGNVTVLVQPLVINSNVQ